MASIDKVGIGNLALSNIGEQSVIESFEEQTTPARQIGLWYDRMRRQALEYHNWSFARKRQTLALHPDPIPLSERWQFRYVYPADCLKFREIENPLGQDADAIPYTIESSDSGLERTILTNVEEATGIYTFDQVSTQMFSSLFVDALAALLASKIAFQLTGKRSIAAAWRNEYLRVDRFGRAAGLIVIAAVADGEEQIKEQPREAEHIRARA